MDSLYARVTYHKFYRKVELKENLRSLPAGAVPIPVKAVKVVLNSVGKLPRKTFKPLLSDLTKKVVETKMLFVKELKEKTLTVGS